jgi:peptidoglycan/xylan/chitin deacetylase (PgdA/CDA1 family)
LKLHSTSRPLRLLIPAVAIAAAFAAGYLAGHGKLGASEHVSIARAASHDDSAAVAASAEATRAAARAARYESPVLSPPTDPVSLPLQKAYDLRTYEGKVIYSAPHRTRRIALTFDDGPSENTEAILAVLREHKAKATFFFVGDRMVGRESKVLDVVRQGSEVANHTWNHVELKRLTEAQVEAQIRYTQEEIERTTGVQNEFVRPKAGKFDKTAMRVVRRMGLVMVGWDAYGHDTFNDGKTVAEIESFAVRQTRGGSIILLHEANPSTVKALPAILRRLEAEGYQCVTLADLLSAP